MRIIGYIIGFLWCLPHTLFALLVMLWYRPHGIRWSDGCIEFIAGRKRDKDGNDRTRIWGKFAAQSFACPVIGYATEADRANPVYRRHERTHTLQGMVLGLLFGPIYGIIWAAIAIFAMPDEPTHWPGWRRSYYEIPFERQARRRGDDITAWGT
jgi:hypothetical protein